MGREHELLFRELIAELQAGNVKRTVAYFRERLPKKPTKKEKDKDEMYIPGLHDHNIIMMRNPYKTSIYQPLIYKEFEYSDWLVQLKNKLTNRYYRWTVIRNRFICWSITILVGILVVALGIYGAWLLFIRGIDTSMLGWTIGLATIAAGMKTLSTLEDYFPTDNMFLDINSRKRK